VHPGRKAEDGEPLIWNRRAQAARPLRVAVLYNLKENAPNLNGQRSQDLLVELDTRRNVDDYVAAIRALGHDVAAYEGDAALPEKLAARPVDICFNTCEGYRGDSREAQVPALLEMLGVPYSASQVLALALTLDKAMTKRVLAQHGLPTPRFQEFHDPRQPLDPALRARLEAGLPLFVKPNREGTSIGIHRDSVVSTEAALRERVAHHLALYRQTVLVEEYIEGRDVTCGLVGNLRPDGSADDLHIFPISEVDYSGYRPGTEHFYSYELKVDLADEYRWLCPAPLPDEIAAEVRRLTLEAFRACGCLDVCRVDFRLDARNRLQPLILEVNALPGMGWNSDLTRCAEAEGFSHYRLVQTVFNAAVDRYGLPRARRGIPNPNYVPGDEWRVASPASHVTRHTSL
jgi:D-alanine-D-alanine ligase